MEETTASSQLTPLEWCSAKAQFELAFGGKIHRFEWYGPFLRIGRDPRCEVCIPGLPYPVSIYIQIQRTYVAVLDLADSYPASSPNPVLCEPVLALPGATVWLQPNARLTLESLIPSTGESESFAWENFNVEDVRIFPNTLVAKSGLLAVGEESNRFRLRSNLTLIGRSNACHIRPEHKQISKFQAVLFRGEFHGSPMRVIDLFGEYPTLVENQQAHGLPIEMGNELKIGNLTFITARFLYNASRPEKLLEANTQFTQLPIEKTAAQRNSIERRIEQRPESGSASIAKKLVKAIGLDRHNPLPAPVQRDLLRAEQPKENFSSGTIPDPPDLSSLQTDFQGLKKNLDELRESQKDLQGQVHTIKAKLEGLERSLESIPDVIQSHGLQIEETIDSLKQFISTQVELKQGELNRLNSSSDSRSSIVRGGPTEFVQASQTNATVKHQPSKGKNGKGRVASQAMSNPRLARPSAVPKEQIEPNQQGGLDSREEESSSLFGKWIAQLHRSGLFTNGRKRESLVRRDPNENPIVVGSRMAGKRKRLRANTDDNELLAASESENESLVLGSLVGFRYRSARVALIRWSLFFSAIGLCAFFGLPALWSRIPEGWRERIWQIVTLQETPKQQGAEIDTPVTPGSPRTKGDDVSPLINKPKVQQAPAPNNSLLAPSPPIPRGPVTIPSLENPLSEDASQESPIDAVPPVVLPLQRPSTKL